MHGIPVIDIAALRSSDDAARAAVAGEIGKACRHTGFFAIVGHGVSPSLIDDAFAAAREFFRLPIEAKEALAISRHGHNRGYVGLGVETLDRHTVADQKEAFNLIWTDGKERPPNLWPAAAPWRDCVELYFDAVLAVGRRLHRAFAIDLSMPEAFFVDKLDAPLATLRFLRYPGVRDADRPGVQSGAGTHTDYGNVTLLATDGVAGLQVGRRDGDWIAAPAVPGAFICNIGDCLMRWTNDVYVSTPHRVVAPPRERHSIAFFLDPNPDAEVRALPTCIAPGQSAHYEPITAAQCLQQRFDSTYAGYRAG